jgi:heme-degrading monooxygenase HmoA
MSAGNVALSLTVMEAGFKVIPGREARWEFFQGSMIPMGMSQPGFNAVYGGTIHDSSWLYFGVRFASQDDMEAWHQHPAHQAVQKSAFENFWTAVYIRKWRQPTADDRFGDRLMAETRLHRAEPLDAAGLAAVKAALADLEALGASRFETLHDEFEAQPYLFVGPLAIAPAQGEGTLYTLITHWSSIDAVRAWQASPSYRALAGLGSVATECFIPFVETGQRERLDADRLQRDWVLQGHDF